MLITLIIIAITCAISIYSFQNPMLLGKLLFRPTAIRRGQFYRFITHGFVHADGQHLLFNMFTLFFFGRAMEPFFERHIGPLGFVIFYVLGIAVAILPSYLQHANDSRYQSLGASGAVSAVLFSFILLAPWSMIYVFFFPIPAIIFAVLYSAYTFYAARSGTDNINHSAHMWGAAYGVIFTLVMEPRLWEHFTQQLFRPGIGQ